MKVPAEQLRSVLVLTSVRYVAGKHSLAVVDSTLESPAAASVDVAKIDNFSFSPSPNSVKAGTKVTWINHDDIPHNVVATDKSFASAVLDTDQKFTHQFDTAGEYNYFCSLHPRMTVSWW
jgi:plastocyanin